MNKITIIGATGSLGRAVTKTLLAETEVNLTLFSRTAQQLPSHPRVSKVSGNLFDKHLLEDAVAGSSLVFVALSGDLPNMISAIIEAMNTTSAKRLIFVSSYGIYGELPGQNGQVDPVLAPYREAADRLEQSHLDYTILRPGWFDNSPNLSYQLYPKGEVVYGHRISRAAIAKIVKEIVVSPDTHCRQNLAITRQ